jgi:hypothetical protein
MLPIWQFPSSILNYFAKIGKMLPKVMISAVM